MANDQQPAAAAADDRPKPKKGTLAAIVGLAAAAGLFVAVPADESGRVVEATIAADGTATVKHISGKQYLRSYKDIVGVETACDGIAYVKPGTYTEAQCAALLEQQLVIHATAVMKCTPGLAASGRDNQRIAATSLAYNVGPGAYCRSSVPRLFNQGRARAACLAMLDFNRATFAKPPPGMDCRRRKDGRWSCVIKGLDARRKREVHGHKVGKTFVPGCLTGLPPA